MSREAMKLALDALVFAAYEDIEYDDACDQKVREARNALRQALAQPEQEPVAFINVEKQKLEWAKLTSWHTPTIVNLPKIPLYTAPPKREWVGLTAPEVQECYDLNPARFASRIEAKLKERNT